MVEYYLEDPIYITDAEILWDRERGEANPPTASITLRGYEKGEIIMSFPSTGVVFDRPFPENYKPKVEMAKLLDSCKNTDLFKFETADPKKLAKFLNVFETTK